MSEWKMLEYELGWVAHELDSTQTQKGCPIKRTFLLRNRPFICKERREIVLPFNKREESNLGSSCYELIIQILVIYHPHLKHWRHQKDLDSIQVSVFVLLLLHIIYSYLFQLRK